jgi:putrescine transport system ATP-binding protein
VVAIEGDQAVIQTRLERPMRMRSFQPLVLGTRVTIAVRPEKMRLCQEPREDLQNQTMNRLAGIVEDIAYLGDVSIYGVRVADDLLVEMTLTNAQPRTEQALTWGQAVTIEWSPTSGVVLTE